MAIPPPPPAPSNMAANAPIGPQGLPMALPVEIYSYLVNNHGVSHNHAMGIINNMMHESNFQYGVEVSDPSESYTESGGTRGTIKQSGGLAQWRGDRLDSLKTYVRENYAEQAEATGDDSLLDYKNNWRGQIDYLMSENDTQRYLRQDFESAEDASKWYTYHWERPADKGNIRYNFGPGADDFVEARNDSTALTLAQEKRPDLNITADMVQSTGEIVGGKAEERVFTLDDFETQIADSGVAQNLGPMGELKPQVNIVAEAPIQGEIEPIQTHYIPPTEFQDFQPSIQDRTALPISQDAAILQNLIQDVDANRDIANLLPKKDRGFFLKNIEDKAAGVAMNVSNPLYGIIQQTVPSILDALAKEGDAYEPESGDIWPNKMEIPVSHRQLQDETYVPEQPSVDFSTPTVPNLMPDTSLFGGFGTPIMPGQNPYEYRQIPYSFNQPIPNIMTTSPETQPVYGPQPL